MISVYIYIYYIKKKRFSLVGRNKFLSSHEEVGTEDVNLTRYWLKKCEKETV